jgi:hypothetical protein
MHGMAGFRHSRLTMICEVISYAMWLSGPWH